MMFDVIIIGAGPAGLTASIYLARAKKKIAIIEKDTPGGKMIMTNHIANYPGVPNTDGVTLAQKMLEQVMALNVDYFSELVLEIKKSQIGFEVVTNENTYITKLVLVATGTLNSTLGVKGEKELIGHGISYCANCDAALYKDKITSIIGNSNTALEESLYLANICKTVYIINRKETFNVKPDLLNKVLATDNIIIYNRTNVKEFISENNSLSKIVIQNTDTSELLCQGAFLYIGYEPATYFLQSLSHEILDEKGFIIVNSDYETIEKGIFASGDCINHPVKQIATAVGDSAYVASIMIKRLS